MQQLIICFFVFWYGRLVTSRYISPLKILAFKIALNELLLLSPLFGRTLVPIPPNELNALHDLYFSTSGDNWRWDSVEKNGNIWNFTDGADPCIDHWQGVGCTSIRNGTVFDLHVDSISLTGYRLRGTLPASLTNITELDSLVLAFNALHGPMPAFLGNFTALTYLDLTENLFTGRIPDSFYNLTKLTTLTLCANTLSGTVPSYIETFTSLKALGLCDSGFTGTIPAFLGNLPELQILALQNNELHGTIPDSLYGVLSLQWLYLYKNHLTGTVSDSLCELSNMQRFLLYSNALTGTIPECLGAVGGMTYLDVSSNDLHGSLPASLSDLDQLLFLWAHDNQLTGSIPENIGNCDALTEIYLSGNYLSQSLPPSIGQLNHLTSVYLQDNLFTGSLNNTFNNSVDLKQIYLQNNIFSGPLPKPFPCLANLTELFLQSNKFSGSLTGLFDHRTHHSLETLQLSDNQFTGPLPNEFFLLPRLQTCAASFNCLTGSIPQSICLNHALTTLILDGLKSAPVCQSKMVPGLSTYYVPGNDHGSIPPCLLQMKNLTTLHLAGNDLTGPLPQAILARSRLTDLSISHNALTGTISAALQSRPWVTLDLSFNRISGELDARFAAARTGNGTGSTTYSLQNNRLSGRLPGALDDLRNISVLGSNMFSCKVDRSDLPQYDGGVATYSCGSDSFNYSYLTLIGALLIGALVVGGMLYYSTFTKRVRFVETWLNRLAKWSVDANPDLHHYRRACLSGDVLCRIGALCTALILLVLVPWYAAASFYYGTYTHMYAWVVSAAFLTGSAPAYAEMGIYMALMLFASASSLYYVLRLDAEPRRATSIRAVAAARPSVQTKVLVSLPVRLGVYTAFLVTNLAIVVGMNVAFVVMVLTQGSFVQFLAQVLVGAFKLVWNTVVTPYMINVCAKYISGTTYHDAEFITLQVLMALLNNIAIPCLVVALISPSCFYSVFDPPPPVVSSFTYKTNARPGLGLANEDLLSYYATEHVSYAPPFAYDYQCSSSLITYYAPAFVYLAIGAALASPALWTALVLWHRRATSGTIWHRALNALLYDIWKPVDAEKPPPAYLFDINLHFVSLITYLGILLTFGVVFPPVAVAMCVTMISVNWQVKLSVGWFLHRAKKAHALRLIQLVEQECKGAVSLIKLRRSLFLTIVCACSFLGLFLFDTLGDAKGLTSAVPILVVMWMFPLVIYFLAWLRVRLTGIGADLEGRGTASRESLTEGIALTPLSTTPRGQQENKIEEAEQGKTGTEDAEVVNVLVVEAGAGLEV